MFVEMTQIAKKKKKTPINKGFAVFEHVKESLHTSLPVVLWLIHLVAGRGSYPTQQRKQSSSLNKKQSLIDLSDLRNSKRVWGSRLASNVVSRRFVKTGH